MFGESPDISTKNIRSKLAPEPQALTEFDATFERRHIIESVCNALIGSGLSVEHAIQKADVILSDQIIVEIGASRNGTVFSTSHMISTEMRLVETAIHLAQTRIAAPNQREVLNVSRRRCAPLAGSRRAWFCG